MCSFQDHGSSLWLFSVPASLFVLDLKLYCDPQMTLLSSNTGQMYDLYRLINVLWSKY